MHVNTTICMEKVVYLSKPCTRFLTVDRICVLVCVCVCVCVGILFFFFCGYRYNSMIEIVVDVLK